MDGNLSKHERRELRIEQRREQRQRESDEIEKKKLYKKIIIYAAVALAILAAVFVFLSLPKPGPVDYDTRGLSFPLGSIHWHATPLVYVCGENIPTPVPPPDRHLGSPTLHTHDDRQIHIEGSISRPSEITIGAFMANIGMRFTDTQLTDRQNGDACPGGEKGKVKLVVNGKENSQLANYIIRDGDRIEIRFE